MMPQCGLAPGFISIAAHDLAGRFDELDEVRMRVGALTEHPTNGLRYELTWSVEGLVHEYLAECDAIVDGKMSKVQPLEGYETFTLDGTDYEAFNTSGGVGTLGDTLAGRVRNLNYKTIRYPGHCAIMKRLIGELGLDEATLTEILGYALPRTSQDVVLIFVSATGRNGGELREESFVRKVYSRVAGRRTLERDPDHHRLGDLRGARSGPRGPAAAAGLRPPGGHRPRGLSRQPLRPELRLTGAEVLAGAAGSRRFLRPQSALQCI